MQIPPKLELLGYTIYIAGDTLALIPPVVLIPAGKFIMGSDPAVDPLTLPKEMPLSAMMVADFSIARYPVTVAEYACAIKAGVVPASVRNERQPPDHPATDISWEDAIAYADWLRNLTGEPWRLPTEAEWEKAARGTDGRIYPWGNEWGITRATTLAGGYRNTTPIDAHPDGISPYGVLDLISIVSEWCSTLYAPYPYNGNDGREERNAAGRRVCRGGAWLDTPHDARAAYRGKNAYGLVGGFTGVRLARSSR